MKLSEMNVERAYDCIAECLIPIGNICCDEEAVAGLKKLATLEGLPPFVIVGVIAKECPSLMKNHKEDVFTIISTIKGVSKEEYKKSTDIGMLIKDIMEMINDENLQVLFRTAQTKGNAESFGAVQVITGGKA